MTQPYHIVSDEPGGSAADPSDDSSTSVGGPRDVRILLRVPDCSPQAAAMARKSRSRRRAQSETTEATGPWWQLLAQPSRWPRIAVAAALGVLVGMVLIVASRETKSWLPGGGEPEGRDDSRQRQVIRPTGPSGNVPKSTVWHDEVPGQETPRSPEIGARRDSAGGEANPPEFGPPEYETSHGRQRPVSARVEGIIY